MGTAHAPPPVKLIASLLAASEPLLSEARHALSNRFGPIDAQSEPAAWEFSRYYQDEMGDRIVRQFVSFERLTTPGKLAGLKQLTNELEQVWRTQRGRQVNIDPGYLSALKLVLATTKDAAHRIYLSGGIYAEVTLEFRDGRFQPYTHTYPDYAAASACEFFERVRATYLGQLRTLH